MKYRFLIILFFGLFCFFCEASKPLISFGEDTYIEIEGKKISFDSLPVKQQQKLEAYFDSISRLDINPGINTVTSNIDEILNPEFIARFKVARFVTIILAIIFIVNIPFYIRWAKKQEGSDEVLLYNVEGKFTYLSILLWVERIEELYEGPLKKQRAKIEQFYNIAQRGNKSIKVFKRKIHDQLLIKAFGPKMLRTAFGRMDTYTRFTYSLDVLVYACIIYATIMGAAVNQHIVVAILFGGFAGNIIAAPTWLICHLIFNGALQKAAKKEIKAGRGVGMRIIMAQFYGAFGGILWKDLYYLQGRSSWTFGGGSPRKGWGRRANTASYKTGFTAEELKEEMDFDDN